MVYDILLLIHILSAMVWVGGGFLVVAVERHAYKAGGRELFSQMRDALEWVDDRIFTPAPLLVVVTGVAMVVISNAWSFSQPWIYLALALIAVEFAVGYRHLNRLKSGRQEGTDSLEYKTAVKTWLRFAPTAIASYGVIVVLMLFKPGG